jgi:acetylglutamate kinase
MTKQTLNIVKIGGNIIDHPEKLSAFLSDFSRIKGKKILVHGGGKIATQLAESLNIPQTMVNGRRITDAETLKIAVMVYAGLINKEVVARLQANNCNAIGLTGADGGTILSQKRPVKEIDYGFVGDIQKINAKSLEKLLKTGFIPIICALTHDGNGQMLNTNADTIASAVAVALATNFNVTLTYCFEKKGVLRDINDDNSLIANINEAEFMELKAQNIVHSGMLPKLENAFAAIQAGVGAVAIGQAENLLHIVQRKANAATILV